MTEQTLRHSSDCKLVQEIIHLYQNGNLNLEPGFQRQSVWKENDRAKLIDSIIRNYPLPAIFLYRRYEDGELIYDVIDGKQRLESILMFIGLMRGRFSAKVQLAGSERMEWIDWGTLRRRKLQHLITGYSIPTIEVDGDFTDIEDIFVRINSTGKALTAQEKRHARYYHSPFLKEANRIAKRFEQTLHDMGVLSTSDISRMKHVELIAELMVSFHQGDVLNKKAALDRFMSPHGIGIRDISKASAITISSLKRLFKVFPKLSSTRFVKQTDFYSLAVLIGKFEKEGYILSDRRRNNLAWDLLVAFGTKVDEMREKQRKLEGAKPGEEVYRSYLITVSQMTDDISQRRKREEILRGILASVFAKKDSQRGFTSEQRRIIWNSNDVRRCPGHKCQGKVLTWDDFTIDHIKPYSKGGRSLLKNARLMCRICNAAKGART